MELLAPSGGIEALKAAVYNGADAVYLGVGALNARAKADNFTVDNLVQWTNFCHIYGVKVYLALNILLKDSEIDYAIQLIKLACAAKVDAFIIADMGAYELCRRYAPQITLHASTQMGVHNLYGAQFLERLGFTRVVLARECGLDEIRSIKENTHLEIEYFVHGALCVSFSGGCLFSSVASGNSGNRGKCLQLCRKKYYNSLNGEEGYYLSPKDQCMIDNLQQLRDVGVDSIKIEGRMKSAEYVGVTTATYHKALLGKSLDKDDNYALQVVYNRGGFTKGYAFCEGKTLIFPRVQGHYGVEIGRVTNCTQRGNGYYVEATCNRDIDKFGAKLIYDRHEIGGGEITVDKKGKNAISFGWKNSLPKGTIIRITLDKTKDKNIALDKKLPVAVEYYVVANQALRLKLVHGKIEVNTTSQDIAQVAQTKAVTAQDIQKQLSKFGDTYYTVDTMNGTLGDNVFVNVAALNNLRRIATQALTEKILTSYNNTTAPLICNKILPKTRALSNSIIEVNALPKILTCGYEYMLNYPFDVESILNYAEFHNNIYIKLPKVALSKDIKVIEESLSKLPNSIGIYADNYYGIELAIRQNRHVIYGFGLNVFNSIAYEFYGNNVCVSPEVAAKDYNNTLTKGYVYVYGNLPIMTLMHCPYQVATGKTCAECDYKNMYLQDEYGKYNVDRIKLHNCQFVVNNSACHYIVDDKIINRYYDCRNMDAGELQSLLTTHKLPIRDNKTKGQYAKGVE